jgi:Zn-dependent alcohol dehydrogenase
LTAAIAGPVGAFCVIGGFAEHTVVDQASVLVIDKDIPLDLAYLVACGVTAGVGAARRRARIAPGESVLVVGCGGDGMNVVQGAALCSAGTIIAADIVRPNSIGREGSAPPTASVRGAKT